MSGSLHGPRYEQFREIMVQARKDAALTQTQLSGKIGRPQSFVSKYEVGERRLDVVEFLDLCTALEIKPSVIIEAMGGDK